MGDDFDLFPKRENLDPFSFGKKEKTTESDKQDSGEDLFGLEEQALGPLPDLTSNISKGIPEEPPPPIPDLPLGGPVSEEPSSTSGVPPLLPPPSPTPLQPDAAVPDLMDVTISEGPISEEKTFDEPVFEQEQVMDDAVERSSRRSPSPFVVIGGALIIIIGLLYGALTYLKRDKAPMPAVPIPPVSVAVTPLKPEPAPAPVPESVIVEIQGETPPEVETIQPVEAPVDTVVTPPETVQETAPLIVKPPPKPQPTTEVAPVAVAGTVQYSLQVGAFILDSSVAELEKKLRGLGYEPFLKKGSTTAMMNMLTVGPFGNVSDARAALAKLKEAGVDSNMRRRNDGGAIINAGSYLLKENATSIMKKIRSMGYPVKLQKREARLPMTFVRVGRYPGTDEAANAKQELKSKGLEGIVVKLQ
jgi:cell division septation protein DedD